MLALMKDGQGGAARVKRRRSGRRQKTRLRGKSGLGVLERKVE